MTWLYWLFALDADLLNWLEVYAHFAAIVTGLLLGLSVAAMATIMGSPR
jgi:hypothetical protein